MADNSVPANLMRIATAGTLRILYGEEDEGHSQRKAVIGSMDEARRAGIRHAAAADAARMRITPAMIRGSLEVCCVQFAIMRERA